MAEKRKVTAQHLVLAVLGIAVLALINTYVGPHWFGMGAEAPTVTPVLTGNNSEIITKLGQMNSSLTASIIEVGKKADQAVSVAQQANQTANAKLVPTQSAPVQNTSTTGLVAGTAAAASSTNTMDDQALVQARNWLADAERLYEAAQIADDNADNAIDDEEKSDAEDEKDNANDIVDDADKLKEDSKDLQDKLRQSWSEPRNETAKNMALRTLESVKTRANDARKDAKKVIKAVDEYLKPETEESGQTTPQVVYVQAPVGQQTTTPVTTGVAGYQSQTGGL